MSLALSVDQAAYVAGVIVAGRPVKAEIHEIMFDGTVVLVGPSDGVIVMRRINNGGPGMPESYPNVFVFADAHDLIVVEVEFDDGHKDVIVTEKDVGAHGFVRKLRDGVKSYTVVRA